MPTVLETTLSRSRRAPDRFGVRWTSGKLGFEKMFCSRTCKDWPLSNTEVLDPWRNICWRPKDDPATAKWLIPELGESAPSKIRTSRVVYPETVDIEVPVGRLLEKYRKIKVGGTVGDVMKSIYEFYEANFNPEDVSEDQLDGVFGSSFSGISKNRRMTVAST